MLDLERSSNDCLQSSYLILLSCHHFHVELTETRMHVMLLLYMKQLVLFICYTTDYSSGIYCPAVPILYVSPREQEMCCFLTTLPHVNVSTRCSVAFERKFGSFMLHKDW